MHYYSSEHESANSHWMLCLLPVGAKPQEDGGIGRAWIVNLKMYQRPDDDQCAGGDSTYDSRKCLNFFFVLIYMMQLDR